MKYLKFRRELLYIYNNSQVKYLSIIISIKIFCLQTHFEINNVLMSVSCIDYKFSFAGLPLPNCLFLKNNFYLHLSLL